MILGIVEALARLKKNIKDWITFFSIKSLYIIVNNILARYNYFGGDSMKKLIALVLVLVCVFGLVGCQSKPNTPADIEIDTVRECVLLPFRD